jgi:hypothetical protein
VDYTHLYFWGSGPTRNRSIRVRAQSDTLEPTVEKAKADGVWWPDFAARTDPHVTIAAYPNTGVVDIPLAVDNPGSTSGPPPR